MMFSRRCFFALPMVFLFPGLLQAKPPSKWECTYNECDPYIYDPQKGDEDNLNGDHPIPSGTAFEDLPEDWICPVCGSPKSYFIEL